MHPHFLGWYFKCEGDEGTVALIPARHRAGRESSASVQLITERGAYHVDFPYDAFRQRKNGFGVSVAENRFGCEGLRLSLQTPDVSAYGTLRFGPFTPIRTDIMGPFRYVPFLQCRHSVVSMRHTVTGELHVNGSCYHFANGSGYIEGDRGRSFPRRYVWTQCRFEGGSLMLSVADIPFGAFFFTGVIGVVLLGGKEIRFATYCGARAVRIENGEVVVRQGDYTLTAHLVEKNAHPLRAPISGSMRRTIHESAACRAAYRLQKGTETLLSFETNNASFEYEYEI